MRRLGKGQSVKFFAPVDIDRKIKAACKRFGGGPNDPMGAMDVLRWVIGETCSDLANSVPHWVAQGMDYQNRRLAWDSFVSSNGDHVDELKEYWLQPDAKSLQEMYDSSPGETRSRTIPSRHFRADFSTIDRRCKDLGFTRDSVLRAHMDEEQEREVNVEVEREWLIERPPKATPAQHNICKEVQGLVKHGRLTQGTTAFINLFEALKDLGGADAAPVDVGSWTKKLTATKDFINTLVTEFPANTSDYIRPINWILSFNENAPDRASGVLILLSPFEVDGLLPSIRKSNFVHLHMYSPRVMESCISFEDLNFYTVPAPSPSVAPPDPCVVMQLNLMAGQLYVPDLTTYAKLLDFLGLVSHTSTPPDDIPDDITGDGFVLPSHRRGRMKDICPFTNSPIPFIKKIVGLRRKGMNYFPTHLGRILITSPLAQDDFA